MGKVFPFHSETAWHNKGLTLYLDGLLFLLINTLHLPVTVILTPVTKESFGNFLNTEIAKYILKITSLCHFPVDN